MYILYFAYLFIDGHRCYFHFLATVLLGILAYKYLFKILVSSLLSICPGEELPDYTVILFLNFKGIAKLFSIVAAPFYTLPTVHKNSNFSASLPTSGFFSDFLIVDFLMGMRQYLTLILIYSLKSCFLHNLCREKGHETN